jgi:hypothetical protein
VGPAPPAVAEVRVEPAPREAAEARPALLRAGLRALRAVRRVPLAGPRVVRQALRAVPREQPVGRQVVAASVG